MGQYRQWLQFREIDYQLHNQLHQLETQLVQLQAQVDTNRSQEEMLAGNTIMQALAAYAQRERNGHATDEEPPFTEHQSPHSFSIALQARGSFSAAETPEMQELLRQQQDSRMPDAIPGTPHTELALLPDDINTFIEEHTQTGQQRPPAWWLQTLQQQTPPPSSSPATDEQSRMRPNRLVQRWAARWGKQLHQMQEATKDHE
jgi:hypothetical protein